MAFLTRFVICLCVVAAAVVTPLRSVNPEGDFRDGLLPPIVIDARTSKMGQLRSGSALYDALVLGSSRSMQLGPQLDAKYGTHAYNFAVDSAHIEDYLAIYHWAKRIGLRPRLLAIGLDLEALHDSDKVDERYERNSELVGALGDRSVFQSAVDTVGTEAGKYRRMFTTWYVRDAAQSVRVHLSARLPPEIEALGSDGLLSYPRADAERAVGSFDLDREIASCLPLYVDRFRDMRALSAWRSGLLEQLLREAQADGTRVIAWLTPLHGATIDRLSSTTAYPRLVREANDLMKELSARYGVAWRDLSDPRSFGATATGWYDCAHLDQTNLGRLANALPD